MIALMYHDLVRPGREHSSGFPGRDAARYKVAPDRFEEHLLAIEAAVGRSASQAPAMTFDDGGVSALEAAAALERHGMRGTFLITVNYIGAQGFLDAASIRDLHRRGHVVGSHSCSHPLRMGRWPPSRLAEEWAESRARLADVIGNAVTVASVPGGDYAPAVADGAAEAGFVLLYTSEPKATIERANQLEIRGRYTVHRWTSAGTIGKLASGDMRVLARQRIAWNVKKITKRLAGERYLRVRKLLLRHGDDVAWGDSGAYLPRNG
jgi:peptidoglycan/xylan/chitin deacetylase (PgdA/CDA1 family)